MGISYYLCSMRYLIVCFVVLLTSCSFSSGDDDSIQQVAVAWADAYFNCDYHTAEKYTEGESIKWLRFAASNTTEKDLQLQNENPASVASDDYFPQANDTLYVVVLKVKNYLEATSLDEEPRQSKEGTFHINVVKSDGEWKVRMVGLPRNEKQNHD